MDSSFVFNENTLKRIPQFLVFIIILLLGLPYIGLSLGFDFSAIAKHFNQVNPIDTKIMDTQIHGYFRQTLLQWSGFSLAAVTVLLSFTQFRLSKDNIALIIGLSVLFSGFLEALHTLAIDGLSLHYTAKNNLDALIWTLGNSLGGLIMLVGLIILLKHPTKNKVNSTTFVLLTIFLLLFATSILFYVMFVVEPPDMWFKNSFISRPYEFFSIAIYLSIILFIYPKAYNKFPSILTDSIFYMSVTQIVISIYLMLVSTAPYDSAYNIAYFLKVVTYFIPCICLLMKYVFSYAAVLEAQRVLEIKQNELQYLASHDSLTNLFNRREFEELLEKTIANAFRNKHSIGLLLIDLDNFKTINDTFGHVHGDELLQQFADRLVSLTRKGDILSRVGGDEFTLIISKLNSPSGARRTAERILNELNSPYTINGKLITVTVSIGISVFPDDGNSAEDLLRAADLAMYKSKNCGKNTFQFYTEQLSFLQHRESEVESHLRKAIHEDKELELYYQPKYNLVTQEIMGAEILLRWTNSVLGPVSPDEFIPVSERSSLIIDLGYLVMRKAFMQLTTWLKQYQTLLLFSINISPTQLVNGQFIKTLRQTIEKFQLPTKYLEIEITENVIKENSEEITIVLCNISKLGIQIALDDFGKEYSSLNRLNTLPIDTLKIDKSFISDIKNEHDKVVIVDIIIKLAEELGMGIVAEGIETKEQLNYLIAKHCHLGQGFYLSKPLPAEEFAKLAYTMETSSKEAF